MSSTVPEFDFVVIGGGSAGYAAARSAAALGLVTAVIDGADELGGLCILRGCMPSKTLLQSSDRARQIRAASRFGIQAEIRGVDGQSIIARKRRLIAEFADYRREQLESGTFTLIRGKARLTGPNQLSVDPIPAAAPDTPREVRFATACVATGSRIEVIDLPGLVESGFMTSDDVLDKPEIPSSVIVLGGGAIALEMACYYEGLSSTVTVIQRSDQVLSGSDVDLAEAVTSAMRSRGIALHTGTNLVEIERTESGQRRVHFEQSGEVHQIEAEALLYALGRQPASEGLALEDVGIHQRGRHVEANLEMATSLPHVFAAGDVCGPLEVVHVAIEQGEVAAHNAAVHLGKVAGPPRQIDYRLELFGVFSTPPVATVGLSEFEAARAGRRVIVERYPFNDHGKSMVKDELDGFVKLIADPDSGELLGGAVVGPDAVELIHEIVIALHFRAKAGELASIPHYHPTLSEIWTYPAEDLAERVETGNG